MLRSIHSSPEPHDDHVRRLLDQRAARAEIHGHFHSLSEYSDTPSIYSPACFSPRSIDRQDFESTYTTVHRSPLSRLSASDDTRRAQARPSLNDPGVSILDLDDDSQPPSVMSHDAHDHDVDPEQTTPLPEDDEDADPRMSVLGPKMRFHSRAPWEMDEDALEEEDESDNSASYIQPAPIARGSKVKDGIKKGFFGSSSPKPNDAGRPSGESARSQGKHKKSWDQQQSSRAVPHVFPPQTASMAGYPPNSGPPPALLDRLSAGRIRQNSSTTPTPSLYPSDMTGSHGSPILQGSIASQPRSASPSGGFGAADTSSLGDSSSSSERSHPYANPDIVVPFYEQPATSPTRSIFNQSNISHSDSHSTITHSTTTTTMNSAMTRSTLTADTSAGSMSRENLPRSRTSTFNGKEISPPLTVHHTAGASPRPELHDSLVPPAPSGIHGWMERAASPSFALISLEEARAQRQRSSTVNHPASGGTSPLRSVPFPGQDGEQDFSGGPVERSRARSISAGAKAKNAFQNMVTGPANPPPSFLRRESEPAVVHVHSLGGIGGGPQKSIKHKKSGFMRLFNAREKDKEAAPPVPSLAEAYAVQNAQEAQQRPKRSPIHRVPVPPLSGQHLDAGHPTAPAASPDSSTSSGSLDAGQTFSNRPTPTLNHKRTPPSLTIKTWSQHPIAAGASTSTSDLFSARAVPGHGDDDFRPPRFAEQALSPASAPADVSEFPALKLRPISSVFSAHFTDIVEPSRHSQPSLEQDRGTTSPTSARSPVTPGTSLYARPSVDQHHKPSFVTGMGVSEDKDRDSVIMALQEQIQAAKAAWQRQIWELEGQVRDLKAEVEDLRAVPGGYCTACGAPGRGEDSPQDAQPQKHGVVNRPRARTGTSSRFGNAMP